MKTLDVLPFAFAIFIFSGCYTQLLIEEDDLSATDDEPTYIPPQPPIIIVQPIYPPRPPHPIVPEPIPAPPPPIKNPGGTTENPDTHRDTGYQRRGSDASQQSSQDNTRSSGVIRGGDQAGAQQNSQPVSQIAVPTRGNSGTQSSTPQPSSQNSSTSGRRR